MRVNFEEELVQNYKLKVKNKLHNIVGKTIWKLGLKLHGFCSICQKKSATLELRFTLVLMKFKIYNRTQH